MDDLINQAAQAMTDAKVTIERETLKVALDALDYLGDTGDDDVTPCAWYNAKAEQACDALRAALAAQPAEPPTRPPLPYTPDHVDLDAVREAVAALAQRAEPQEPVAWGIDWATHGDRSCVSIVKRHPDGVIEVVATEFSPYAAPPAPAAVPLTYEQIIAIANSIDDDACDQSQTTAFARAIERAHGIGEKS